jgi:hypothetical protein
VKKFCEKIIAPMSRAAQWRKIILPAGNVHPEFSAKDNKRKSNYSVRGNHFSEISDLQNIGGSDKLLVRFDPCLKYIH